MYFCKIVADFLTRTMTMMMTMSRFLQNSYKFPKKKNDDDDDDERICANGGQGRFVRPGR